MTDKQLAQETISKALASLQDLAKGHSSRGTATTAVESMREGGVGAGSDAGSTQVHHTPANSDPGGWAGSRSMDCPEDGATDHIEEDGTDYKGVSGGLMKSILEKIEKGQALTEAEAYVFKSVMEKAGMAYAKKDKDDDKMDKAHKPPFMKDDDKKDKDDDEAKKSLTEHASENADVQKGLEMSPFLAGWAQVQADAHTSAEQRIVSRLNKSLADIDASNATFQAEMAKSVAALAEVLTAQAQRMEQLESTPARGPKSVSAQPVEKSFGAGGEPTQGGEEMSKSLVLDTMIDMVQKGKLHSQEVVKFESTNELRPDLYQAVLAHRSGR